jgi:hypothetical protein
MATDLERSAFDQATTDVTNLYQNILKRAPDAAGLQYWVDSVSKGTASLADVGKNFQESNEFIVNALKAGQSVNIPSVSSFIKQNQNDPQAVQLAAKQYGLDLPAISNALGMSQTQAQNYFRAAGVPLGTMLTGTVQRTFGTEGGIRQLDKGEDVGTEQVIGTQGDKLVVQQYDAYGVPTNTRLSDPNPSDAQGWLQALGIVGAATGLSNLFDAAAGTAAGAGAGTTAGAAAGTLAPETLAALEAVGQSAIPEIVATTGGLLDAGLAAGAAAGGGLLTPTTTTPSLTVTSTPLPAATIPAEVIAGGLGAGTLATLDTVGTQATQDLVNQAANQNINVAPTTTVVPPVVPGTPATSTIPSTVTNALGAAASGLLSGVTPNAIGNLINAGVGYQQAKQAADDLLASGQISQQQYNNLAANIQGQYNQLGNQFSGMGSDIRSTYNLLSQEAGQNVGQFTPYGVTSNLFEKSGQDIQTAAMKAAQQSFNQAGLTDVDQLSQDYYNKLSALSAPDIARQRLATEERLRAQGRLGVSGSAYGGSSPELLAQEQAIAQQQLQRELQSRQAALGERGTLLSQGATALQPAVQLGQFGSQAAQQQFANDLARQQYLTGLKSQGVQGEIAARTQAGNLAAQGIQSAAGLQRQGLQDLLARQLMATEARSGANQRLTQTLFGGSGGSVGGVVGNALGGLFNTNAAGGINSAGFGTGLGYGNQDIGLFI